jgi:hypothetical protein
LFLGLTAGAGAAVAAGCTAKSRTSTRGPAVTAGAPATQQSGSTGSTATRPGTASKASTASEYHKPGTTDWKITRLGSQHAVEAYADTADVVPGEPVTLYISSTASKARVEAFRVGWYGGAQARRVWHTDDVRVHRQQAPQITSGLNTVTAHWQPSLTMHTTGWPEGAYLIRISTDTGQRYVPLIVRTVDSSGKVLLVHATATWQAYNTWGGHSLYQGPGGSSDYANRALVVSFDRPYDHNGAHKFLEFERSVAALVDRLRLPVAYTTSAHVHTDPGLLRNARAIISLGHDEYWTPQMRANVAAARDAGVNIAFLGANACFRRIRLQPSAQGANRQIVCYKTDYQKDPMYGVHNALVTNDYREPPDPHPECTLIGTYYEAFPTAGDYVVLTPDSWLFRGTGAVKGSTYPRLIGPEYDRANPVVPLPRPFQVVAHSPITCKGTHTYSDSAYYTTKSGAGVFNVGTMDWTRAILRDIRRFDARTAQFVNQVTANMLNAFKDGPATEKYPAIDNLDALHPFVGDPTWAHHNLW